LAYRGCHDIQWLVQISGAASASYTYDANGNRLTQAQTKGVVTSTTSYHWNAQDQLVRVDHDSGSGPQTLAQYRYNAGNLRAEKFLSNAGLNKATQGSAATYSPLAYERIQWDGLHARRSFEIRGTDNIQTLHSDTDAAVLAGNTAPWLFNRTQYTNGLGSTSSTTQLHADSNGNLVATVASEGGTAKADSLLLYSAYGSVDSEASGNAGVGLKSNGHSSGLAVLRCSRSSTPLLRRRRLLLTCLGRAGRCHRHGKPDKRKRHCERQQAVEEHALELHSPELRVLAQPSRGLFPAYMKFLVCNEASRSACSRSKPRRTSLENRPSAMSRMSCCTRAAPRARASGVRAPAAMRIRASKTSSFRPEVPARASKRCSTAWASWCWKPGSCCRR
jgi:hypothetical protein